LIRNFSLPLSSSRSQVHLTSAAVNGLPSCHLTPVRNLNVSSVPSSFHAQLVASSGATPLLVAADHRILGTVRLKDIVKGGMKERFDHLRAMGIRTVMITGDNRLTAAAIAQEAGGSLISPAGPFNIIHDRAIAGLTERLRLPAISIYRQFVMDGGLMAYGPESADVFRRSAEYVDRILQGAKPAELPVQAPRKFELVINLKAARSLGLVVPRILLAGADSLIE